MISHSQSIGNRCFVGVFFAYNKESGIKQKKQYRKIWGYSVHSGTDTADSFCSKSQDLTVCVSRFFMENSCFKLTELYTFDACYFSGQCTITALPLYFIHYLDLKFYTYMIF